MDWWIDAAGHGRTDRNGGKKLVIKLAERLFFLGGGFRWRLREAHAATVLRRISSRRRAICLKRSTTAARLRRCELVPKRKREISSPQKKPSGLSFTDADISD